MQESIVFLVRVQCRRKESSRSISHLLMSFLLKLYLVFDCGMSVLLIKNDDDDDDDVVTYRKSKVVQRR